MCKEALFLLFILLLVTVYVKKIKEVIFCVYRFQKSVDFVDTFVTTFNFQRLTLKDNYWQSIKRCMVIGSPVLLLTGFYNNLGLMQAGRSVVTYSIQFVC